jgi:hypothetical protein
MTAPSSLVVVMTLELLADAFVEEDCASVLYLWREDKLRPAVNPSLLIRYFKLLRSLGLSDLLVRRWAWWFTRSEKAVLIGDDSNGPAGLRDTYVQLAQRAKAQYILLGKASRPPPATLDQKQDLIEWITAQDFLKRLESDSH